MIKLSDDPDECRAAVLEVIPLGTAVNDARLVMRTNRFKVQRARDSDFTEHHSGEEITHKGIDFLFCDRRKTMGQLTARRWQIAVVHEDGAVTDIYVTTGLIGP